MWRATSTFYNFCDNRASFCSPLFFEAKHHLVSASCLHRTLKSRTHCHLTGKKFIMSASTRHDPKVRLTRGTGLDRRLDAEGCSVHCSTISLPLNHSERTANVLESSLETHDLAYSRHDSIDWICALQPGIHCFGMRGYKRVVLPTFDNFTVVYPR